jgi:diguanylate cyclase (GGDEF)-like protein/PAS domain S-box-containing protein
MRLRFARISCWICHTIGNSSKEINRPLCLTSIFIRDINLNVGEDLKNDAIDRYLTWSVVAIIVVTGCLIAAALFHLKEEAVSAGKRFTQSIANVLAEQTVRTVQTVDQRLQLTAIHLNQLRDDGDLNEQSAHVMLRNELKALPFVRAIWVMGRDGRIVYDSDVGNLGISLADREYFKLYITQPGTNFSLGAPVRSRSTGTWLISASYPLRSADGKFLGVIAAALEPPYFDKLWSDIEMGDTGAIALYRRDGILMASTPADDTKIGKIETDKAIFNAVTRDPRRATIRGQDISASKNRVISYQTLSAYPDLAVVVSQSVPEMLASWRSFSMLIVSIWLTACIGVVYLARMLRQAWQQRQHTMNQLVASEARYERAANGANDGIWEWDVATGENYMSPRWKRLLGYADHELANVAETFFNQLHPDDQMPVNEAIRVHFEQRKPYEIELRLRCKNGEYRWFLSRGQAEWDEQGKPIRMSGFIADITERKKSESALRNSEQKFAAAFRSSPDAITITSIAEGRFVEVSDSVTRLTGYTREELLAHSSIEFWADNESRDRYVSKLKECGHVVDMEAAFRIKSGEVRIGQLSGELIGINGQTHILGIIRDITEIKRAEKLIWEQAHFDSLTKLPNRRMFATQLQQQIEQAKNSGTALTLLLIDLDQFKEVNDTLGHDKGDLLLVGVARRIADCLNQSATLARLGGDEFTVILSEPKDIESTNLIAKQIIATLTIPFQLGVEKVFISASIGIAQLPDAGVDIEDLLRHADQAMYAAKNAGRNRYAYFSNNLQEAAQSRMRLTNDLRNALAENQFEVYYQPIVELATGNIRKAEALIRWHHPTRGMVSPVEFIPLAEASGLIIEIGEWVFKKAAEQVQRMRTMNHSGFQISVNVSPMQFRNDDDLKVSWLSHLATLGLPAQSMVVEITEGLLLDLTSEVTDKLLAFGFAGIQVALDDFGTGYSSLAYLKKFDIDYLKIDRAFVHNIETDQEDRALCEAIIVMAHKLGLRVIAEGVETAVQRDLLLAAGCDFAQGYFYSKPVPVKQFESLL